MVCLLYTSKDEVSVAEEIENLKNYIIIQKLRYGDLFETVYNIDEEVKAVSYTHLDVYKRQIGYRQEFYF